MEKLNKLTLLYAEDDEYLNILLQSYFIQIFEKVHVAEDGQTALDIYHKEKPDVLILDIEMPKMTGLELARKIRQDDKETKIILLTAHADKNTLLQAVELGLVTYVEKPVNELKLQQAMKKLSNEYQQDKIQKLWCIDDNQYNWNDSEKALYLNNEVITLTKKEQLLLQAFITSRKKHLNYIDIYDTVWLDDEKEYSESAIKTVIKNLRSKLPAGAIKNSYGLGYYLNLEK